MGWDSITEVWSLVSRENEKNPFEGKIQKEKRTGGGSGAKYSGVPGWLRGDVRVFSRYEVRGGGKKSREGRRCGSISFGSWGGGDLRKIRGPGTTSCRREEGLQDEGRGQKASVSTGCKAGGVVSGLKTFYWGVSWSREWNSTYLTDLEWSGGRGRQYSGGEEEFCIFSGGK